MKSLTKPKIWLFAVGQFGWALLSGLIGSWLVSFYMPSAEMIKEGHQVLIPQGKIILGFLTVIGGITALGRIFDAITDPLIASMSDKCKSKSGRRIPFMKWAAIPLALTTLLVFCAPFGEKGTAANSVWLCIAVLAYYFFITMYCTPYTALYSEITHTEKERMLASSAISLTFIIGTGIGYLGPIIWGALTPVLSGDRMLAIRLTFTAFAVIALLCMFVPVFAIRERDYVDSVPSQASMLKSLSMTFRNKSFRVFVASDVFYFLGLTMFQTGIPYFVTSLIGLPEGFQSMFLVLMTVLSLVFYPGINSVTAKVGKKKMVIFAFAMFTVVFAFTAFTGFGRNGNLINTPFGPATVSQLVQGLLMILFGSLPMAIFGILPQAMVADCAEYDQKLTGESRQGMFFAARTFCFKLGQAIAMVLFTSLATIGSTKQIVDGVEKVVPGSAGYRVAAATASLLCALGGIILMFYNEKKVLSEPTEEEKALARK